MNKIKLVSLNFGLLFFTNLLSHQIPSELNVLKDFKKIQAYKYSGKSIKAFIGFVDLIEGAENLIDYQDDNTIQSLQRLMEGVTCLIEASIASLPEDDNQQTTIEHLIQDFKDRINNLVQAGIVKSEPDHDLERQKLIEGLAKILYNSVYILIDPKSIGDCLTNILSGIYKVVSAILADGKVDYTDWAKVLRALASIFKLPYRHNKNYHNQNQNYSDTAI